MISENNLIEQENKDMLDTNGLTAREIQKMTQEQRQRKVKYTLDSRNRNADNLKNYRDYQKNYGKKDRMIKQNVFEQMYIADQNDDKNTFNLLLKILQDSGFDLQNYKKWIEKNK